MVKFWKTMGKVGGVATILLLVGGINWGLIGASTLLKARTWNVVNWVFGSYPIIASIIYLLVGLSAIYSIYALFIKKGK